MFDATFKAYSGPGYTHASGGALLQPADFRGLASLLVRTPGEVTRSDARMRRALQLLSQSNPLVRSTLTCLEREFDVPLVADPFPASGGLGAFPAVPEDETQLPAHDDDGSTGVASGGATAGAPQLASHLHSNGARLLSARPIVGAAQSVYEPPADARDQRNGWERQQVGTKRRRHAPATVEVAQAAAKRASLSPDNAVHTTLFPCGEVCRAATFPPPSPSFPVCHLNQHPDMYATIASLAPRGGWHDTLDGKGCSLMAYRKKTLASVADPFRSNEEYLWYDHGLLNKKAMHGSSTRMVDAAIAVHANKQLVQAQKAEWDSRMRVIKDGGLNDLVPHVSLAESFTGSVPSAVVGGKAYWYALRRQCHGSPGHLRYSCILSWCVPRSHCCSNRTGTRRSSS